MRFLESKKNRAQYFRSQFFAKYLYIMMPEANKVKKPIQTDKISLSGNKYILTHPVIFFFFTTYTFY